MIYIPLIQIFDQTNDPSKQVKQLMIDLLKQKLLMLIYHVIQMKCWHSKEIIKIKMEHHKNIVYIGHGFIY